MSQAAVDASVVSSLSDEEAAIIADWLQSEDGYRALLKAAEETRVAITQLDRTRSVDREDLYRPITLL